MEEGKKPNQLVVCSFRLYLFKNMYTSLRVPQVVLVVNNPPASTGDVRDTGSIPGSEDPLEKGMATHCIILTWRIPWTKEPSGLSSMESQRVGHT